MRTVIAVILHPSRALFDSIRQSCVAAQNPQTETAFLARNSIKGSRSPFYRTHRDHHARPYPVCKAQNRATRFVIVSSDFVGSTKIKTSPKTLQMFVGPCGGPCGVIKGPCGCPCGCSNRSLASLTRLLVSSSFRAIS